MERAIAVIPYYNIMFLLELKDDTDIVKYRYLNARIKKEGICMRNIHDWCKMQKIKYTMRFCYLKKYPLKANLWNYIQFMVFKWDIWLGQIM